MKTYRFYKVLEGRAVYVEGESFLTWYDALVQGRETDNELFAMVLHVQGVYKRDRGMLWHRDELCLASADVTDILQTFAQSCVERARSFGSDRQHGGWAAARLAPMEARLTRVASKLREVVKVERACDDLGLGSLDALSWFIQDGCDDSGFLEQTGLREAMMSVATHVRDAIREREACWQMEQLDWQMQELFRTVFAEEEVDA